MRTLFCLAAALTVAASPELRGQTGNGAPGGPHYNLNIIGVSHDKNPNMNAGSGSVIFVDLGSRDAAVTTKILLSQSADAGVFAVLDKNGTDGEASFSLPAPGSYTIWARALGTPGGQAKVTSCATDIALSGGDAGVICSTQHEVFVRGTGKSSFRNVTDALTTITLDAGSAAALACGSTSVSLFNPCLQGFFWQYDNNGLRLLQVRFYPNPS
jgi:hypothetical protein